jgi:integrase
MLPKHVHRVTWASGTVAYYWQMNRGTAKAGPRTRLPDNCESPFFWAEIERLRKGVEADKLGTMPQMIDAYMGSPHYAQLAVNTRREYDRHMGALRVATKEYDADEMKASDVAAFRDSMGDTPAKANAYVKAIASLYAWGRQRGFAEANPATGISKLKIGEYQPWPQWAWEAAQAHFRPEIKTACLLGRYTGQRLGDVLRMRLNDIGPDGFAVVQQKTGKALHVPVRTELFELIADAKRAGRMHLVSRTDGSPFTVDQFHAMWGREMKRLELKMIRDAGLSFHGLRKTMTNDGAESGLSPSEIGSISGQTIQIIQHYTKGSDQKRLAKTATEKLERGTK